jgi:hypothetical protein
MNPLASAWAMFPAPTNPILIVLRVFIFLQLLITELFVRNCCSDRGAASIRQTVPDLCNVLLSLTPPLATDDRQFMTDQAGSGSNCFG